MEKNKLIAAGLILTIGVFLAAGCIGGGETVPAGQPISNCQELQNIQNNLSADYYLANDINCSETENWNDGEGFKPIGRSPSNEFEGSFKGNGHVITRLHIYKDLYSDFSGGIGLFGFVGTSANITNVGMKNINITGRDKVGGLIGHNKGSVSGCYITGSVKGSNLRVGGLIGENRGTISNSYSNASINGNKFVGGLVGSNFKGKISKSYATGRVIGKSDVGGLVAYNINGEVSSSFWNTETSGQDSSRGGTGLITPKMKNKSIYMNAGWNFQGTWYMPEDGYPHLQWEK